MSTIQDHRYDNPSINDTQNSLLATSIEGIKTGNKYQIVTETSQHSEQGEDTPYKLNKKVKANKLKTKIAQNQATNYDEEYSSVEEEFQDRAVTDIANSLGLNNKNKSLAGGGATAATAQKGKTGKPKAMARLSREEQMEQASKEVNQAAQKLKDSIDESGSLNDKRKASLIGGGGKQRIGNASARNSNFVIPEGLKRGPNLEKMIDMSISNLNN